MLNIKDVEYWYNENAQGLEVKRKSIHSLVEGLLDKNAYFKLESRVKTKESLENKVTKKNKYKNISEITDLIGIRVVVPLNSDVDNVVDTIRQEFKVDEKNTIDKRKKKTNEFGYKSFHVVCQLDDKRKKLPEYKILEELKDIKIEIQIRTILQHAWSDYQHGIGYKGNETISEELERRIYRLSALLEVADEEFTGLSEAKQRESKKIDKQIREEEYDIQISDESIIKFCIESDTIQKLNAILAKKHGYLTKDGPLYGNTLIAERFIFLGFKSINEINEKLLKHETEIIDFIEEVKILYDAQGKMYDTVILFYLVYYELLSRDDSKLIEDFFNEFDLGDEFKRTLIKAKENISKKYE